MKIYGKWDLLFGFLTVFVRLAIATLGIAPSTSAEARVLEEAERDGQRLANEGYRVVASDWFELPLLRIGYLRVTYELESTAY